MSPDPFIVLRQPGYRWTHRLLIPAAILVLGALSCRAASTLSQEITPTEANVGDQVSVAITVQGGDIKRQDSSGMYSMPSYAVALPTVNGLQWSPSLMAQTVNENGSVSTTLTFTLTVTRAGDFTIPTFAVPLDDGTTLHTKPMKLHVAGDATSPAPASSSAPPPSLSTSSTNGPVVMPPVVGPTPPPGTDTDATPALTVPLGSDGQPAKVFMVITPDTTDAYVGQSIPLRIEWFILGTAYADQNSLPTIKGSDFLMKDLAPRFREDPFTFGDQQYTRQIWLTAISAPKSGDIPLQMERDSYWAKSFENITDMFGNIVGLRPNLAHELIPSNLLTIHVHPLPTEGRPEHFTGAIGQFTVNATAQPDPLAVELGEPVILTFSVSGAGNFDYVRCPRLASDPAWKSYVPTSKTDYEDEAHTQGTKTFTESVIPKQGGTLPLPPAEFSYFDPATKHYVTIPLSLPSVIVTGSEIASSPAPTDVASDTAAPPPAGGFLPNRVVLGSLQSSLEPVYGQTWYWAVQGGLTLALAAAALVAFLTSRVKPDDGLAERLRHQLSLQQEQQAMAEAVRDRKALAFFLAARHAIQLQLGARWHLNPEALTLGEIRQRDPDLAETLAPLFTQADEVIYSGGTGGNFDLAHWERHVRELLQPQLQPA
jgi:hypothetical protein